MKRNKIVELILSLMVKLKIKDKRIKYAVLAVLGLLLAASTQLTNLEGEVTKIEPSQSAVEQVVQDGVKEATGNIVEELLKSLF